MNYSALYTEDYANGEGARVTLFVSGCSHGCKGCHNLKAQHPKFGTEYTEDTYWEIISALEDKDGLSLSGGDPLYPKNRKQILELVSGVKSIYPTKDIWLWTGYLLKDIQDLEILKYVDVLIDGKYDSSKPTMLPWRGSDNQVLYRLSVS